MIRIGTIVWFVILALLGVGLFQVKYAVQSKERELKKINRQIAADRDAMRVLEAEWSYLNDPVRLADLARRHTDLAPVMAGQIVTFESLAPRPAAAPDAAPALPPLASAPQVPAAGIVATPVAAKSVPAPESQQENDPVFATSSGASAPATTDAAETDDAEIRAILQDMQANQDQAVETQPGTGKTEPANEAGVE